MFIKPNWPQPKNIHAYSTTRMGGVSQKPYDSFNLGTHVHDNIKNVLKNRQILIDTLELPNTPIWINQTHGKTVLPALDMHREQEADATISDQPNQVCAVLTADCLPTLIADKKGKKVAAVHAGWRGLAQKIITETLNKLDIAEDDTLVWLGPAIGPKIYQVGEEVRESFRDNNDAFVKTGPTQWLCDLYQLARDELHANGIQNIYGGDYCTYSQSDQFFSYRRDGAATGRMATLIWFDKF
jgi:hypothetical protein